MGAAGRLDSPGGGQGFQTSSSTNKRIIMLLRSQMLRTPNRENPTSIRASGCQARKSQRCRRNESIQGRKSQARKSCNKSKVIWAKLKRALPFYVIEETPKSTDLGFTMIQERSNYKAINWLSIAITYKDIENCRLHKKGGNKASNLRRKIGNNQGRNESIQINI